MVLTLLIALALAGAAAALVMRAAVFGRIRTDENVGRIAAYGYQPGTPDQPDRTPIFPKFAELIGAALFRGAPAERQAELRKTILAAGAWNVTAPAVLGYRALAAVLLTGFALWSGIGGGWPPLVVA